MTDDYQAVFSTLTFYIFFLCWILFGACEGGNNLASEALEPVIKITVKDNGNLGNASDIEINFQQQRSTADIKEYRAIVIKASLAQLFDISQANPVSSENYTQIAVDEVYPVKGKVLTPQSKDSDGDVISPDEKYVFGILSVSKDEKRIRNSWVLVSEEFQLSTNNQITNFTRKMEGGSGSLAMNQAGEMYMANYDIVAHLVSEKGNLFPIYKILPNGSFSDFSDSLSLQSGNAVNAQSLLYQAHLLTGEISITSPDGHSTQILNVQGFNPPKPDGMYIDAQDNIFVADQGNGNIIKINADGTSTEIAFVGKNPRGITGDEQGNLYISHNHIDGSISKITPAGDVSILANIPTFKPEEYILPYKIWLGYLVYHDNVLYVAGMSTDRVYKVSMEGEVSVFAGSGIRGVPRGGALTANLNRPIGLVFSQDGKSLYISGSTDVTPQHTQSTKPGQIWEIKLVE